MAWKINFWARLHDGEHAFKLLADLLRPSVDPETRQVQGGGTFPNLFCAHPPFQIDGNYGGCAGIAEMLVQSQDGLIEVLPALPAAWKTGSFSGLKVRGGAEVAAKWMESRVQEIRLKAVVPGQFCLLLPKQAGDLSLTKDRKSISLPVVDGKLTIDLQAGEEICLNF